jgi:hypothetical protein
VVLGFDMLAAAATETLDTSAMAATARRTLDLGVRVFMAGVLRKLKERRPCTNNAHASRMFRRRVGKPH